MTHRLSLLPLLLGLAAMACSSETTTTTDTGIVEIVSETSTVDNVPACLGTPCSSIADCGELSACVADVSCVAGCCVKNFKAEGTACSEGCQVDGVCSGTGECVDTMALECPELDGNPCTAASCDPATGTCADETPLTDGAQALASKCWDGLLCQNGEPDTEAATPTELNLSCLEQDADLAPFGCIEQVLCVDSAEDCLEVAKTDGVECWTGQESGDDECLGHACSDGACVVDDNYSVTCDLDDLPEDCDDACQSCTELTCHWIPDPDAPGDAKKKVRYCKAAAMIGEPCEDGSDCSIDDVCVLKGQTDGTLGKETLGTCQSGEGKTKEDCLADMNKPALPCLITGTACTEEEGCTLDQVAADEWCYPPASVCFDKEGTYCTHLDPKDGQWNEETGCHTELIDVDCEDNNECTIDKCKVSDDEAYCEHKPVEGAACDDSDPCTENDLCVAGECLGDAKCPTASNDPCLTLGCDDTGVCITLPNNGAPCDDNDVCTQTDTCDKGLCLGSNPVDCDDDEICTADSCDFFAGCQHVPADGACDDGNACTVDDTCAEGTCSPGTPLDCDDNDVCTDDSCDPATGCVHTNNVATCDDANACTADDVCAEGLCAGQTITCNDDNPCTDDTCDSGTGCVFTNNTAACDDNDACTTVDQCDEGVCVGSTPPTCDDDNPCTDDSCDPDTGCVFTNNTVPCDDGDACTTVDVCDGGQCSGSIPPDCDDGNPCTDDSCDPGDGCIHVPNVLPCDDSNACTLNDTCNAGLCVGGPAPSCDDNNICTLDSCSPDSGCVYGLEEDGTLCSNSPEWQCQTGVCTCVPQCDGLQCGDDLCEGECGVCAGPQDACVDGQCKCQPDCFEKDCGDDGCGGKCGVCGTQETCTDGLCKPLTCGNIECPVLDGYEAYCNSKNHCEYANLDSEGWKQWDVWIYVTPGSFEMGGPGGECADCPSETMGWESPVHNVTLNYGYFIAKYEVVVDQYEACEVAGECTAPNNEALAGDPWGLNQSENGRNAHPQNGIDWDQARNFCSWIAPGGRLPSEAEWEYAAKGSAHTMYPWGDEPAPTCDNDTAVFNDTGEEADNGCGVGGSWPVGSKPAGRSYVGALDMAGNIQEMGLDCWHASYDGAPDDGSAWTTDCDNFDSRVQRGGPYSWYSGHIRVANRSASAASKTVAKKGARCVRPLPEHCGDGIQQWWETCDDGNDVDDDECPSSCLPAEFQVNATWAGDQDYPHVATRADGSFVVVWQSPGIDSSGNGVVARIFGADGKPAGDEFQVNSEEEDDQSVPNVAALANDTFVVVWQSNNQDGSAHGVYGQLFDVDGAPLGSEFQVNTYILGTQAAASVAGQANGDFLVTWSGGNAQDGSGYGVFGRLFGGNAVAKSDELPVSTHFSGDQMHASAAALTNGSYLGLWMSKGQDGSGHGVFGQRFDSSGKLADNEFQLNSTWTGDQDWPQAASFSDGGFVAVWTSDGQDGSSDGVFGQRFTPDGSIEGLEFQVNKYATNSQFLPSTATLDNDRIVVVWQGEGPEDSSGIHLRMFDADADPLDDGSRVNTYTNGVQSLATAASFTSGDFVVVWRSMDQDGSGWGIYAQRFDKDGNKLFN